jgi:hypothetical protein
MGRGTIRSVEKSRTRTIHPVWRGIGCIWLVLLPILAYAGSWIIVRHNLQDPWFPFTAGLSRQIILPVANFPGATVDFNLLIKWIPGYPLYYADLLVTGVMIFLGFGLTSIFYAFIYSTFGPPKDPYDVMERRSPTRRRK